MSSFFNSTFLDDLESGGDANAPTMVRMYVWPNAVAFEDDDPRYTGTNNIESVATLSGQPGWGNYVAQIAPDLAVTVNDGDDPTFYIITPNPFDLPANFPDTKVAAVSFVYAAGPDAAMVGKLMFTTNTLFEDEPIILHDNDGIIAAPDPVNLGDEDNNWLMYWNAAGAIEAGEGEIVVMKGTPAFEAARTQHVWMYPQRVNMIANPSFEVGVSHWKTTGLKSQQPGGINSAFYGHFDEGGASPPLVLESNTFPLQIRKLMDPGWTIHITARGNGELKVGLVSWPASYNQTVVDWGPVQEEGKWMLTDDSWMSFRTLRNVFDVSYGALRLETDGDFLDIDCICVEPGWLPSNDEDWPYFDGDTRYGALDDYSWYGDTDRPTGTPSRAHRTYSCWYNHRRVVTGRLFQWDLHDEGPGSVFTDEEVAAQGLVFDWVPAGTPVRQHLDVLYANDPQSEVPDVVGPVTQGVPSPW